jgi:hypothetical protein
MPVQVELRMPLSPRLRTLHGGGWDVPFCSCPRSATGILGSPDPTVVAELPEDIRTPGGGREARRRYPRKRRLCPAPQFPAVVEV